MLSIATFLPDKASLGTVISLGAIDPLPWMDEPARLTVKVEAVSASAALSGRLVDVDDRRVLPDGVIDVRQGSPEYLVDAMAVQGWKMKWM